MTSDIFAKEFAPCKRASYSIKVQSDANNEFYTCTVEWLCKSRKEQPQFINAPLEFMKELIKYMRDLFDILSKNKKHNNRKEADTLSAISDFYGSAVCAK